MFDWIKTVFLSAILLAHGSLARRTGAENCWAIEGSVCIPHSLWVRWLAEPSPASWENPIEGKWRVETGFRNTPMLSSGEPKTSREIHIASALPRGTPASPIILAIERLREHISEELASTDSLHLFRAILLGERRRGDPGSVLQLIGFAHLLSLTGIHLYALAWICSRSLLWAGEWISLPAPLVLWSARGLAALSWVAAWLLAGAPGSMLRIWGVLVTRLLARYFGFRWRAAIPLLFGLALGGGIFFGLAIGGAILGAGHGILGIALYSWLFAALWEIWREGHVAFLSPVINTVSFLILSVLVYPAVFFLSFIRAPGFLIHGSNALIILLTKLALKIDSLWVLSKLGLLLGGFFALMIAILPKHYRRRARVTLLVLALGIRLTPLQTVQDVIQLDVGQGDAALVLSEKNGLIDSGSEKSLSDADWIRVLSANGVAKLDFAALTHLDEDHSGGLKRLARLLPIRCTVTSLGEIDSERGQAYGAEIPLRDWSAPCVPYPTYAPKLTRGGANQNMGAVLVKLPQLNYLSAGDATRAEEREIAAWAEPLLQSHPKELVFKISHHGSKTSSDPEVLKLLDPAVALISVGAGNHYGHPSVETLLTLDRLRIPFFRTDQWGALSATEALETIRADGRRRP